MFIGLRAVTHQRAARAAERDGATESEISDAAIRRLALSPIPIFYAHLAVSIIDGICACGKSNVAAELRACQTICPCTYPVIAVFLLISLYFNFHSTHLTFIRLRARPCQQLQRHDIISLAFLSPRSNQLGDLIIYPYDVRPRLVEMNNHVKYVNLLLETFFILFATVINEQTAKHKRVF